MKDREFEDFKNNLILKEINIAKSEDHPNLHNVIKQLENLRLESNKKKFRKRYQKITGATLFDLSDKMLQMTN